MFYNLRKERQLAQEEENIAFSRYLERQQRIGKSDSDLARQSDNTKDIIAGRESSGWRDAGPQE